MRAEVAEGVAGGSKSATKALLWLFRFLDFTTRLLSSLCSDPAVEVGPAARGAYAAALQPYHGWATSCIFTLVLSAAPYRSTFESALLLPDAKHNFGEAEALRLFDLEAADFAQHFGPILERIHAFLQHEGQDDPTPV